MLSGRLTLFVPRATIPSGPYGWSCEHAARAVRMLHGFRPSSARHPHVCGGTSGIRGTPGARRTAREVPP
jgi:hypothetical protein